MSTNLERIRYILARNDKLIVFSRKKTNNVHIYENYKICMFSLSEINRMIGKHIKIRNCNFIENRCATLHPIVRQEMRTNKVCRLSVRFVFHYIHQSISNQEQEVLMKYFKVPNQVLDLNLTPMAFYVLCCLLKYRNSVIGKCFPATVRLQTSPILQKALLQRL